MHLIECFAGLEAESGVAGSDEPFVGMGIQIVDKLFQHGGPHAVVVRGPCEVFALGFLKTSVQCTWKLQVVFVVDDTDASVFIGITLHNLQRVVLGAVVDQYQLPVSIGLLHNAINRLCQKTGTVVAGKNY